MNICGQTFLLRISLDGAVWTNLVDASAGEHQGWEDWGVTVTARYLRFTGLSNSVCQRVRGVVGDGRDQRRRTGSHQRLGRGGRRPKHPLGGQARRGRLVHRVGYDASLTLTNLALDFPSDLTPVMPRVIEIRPRQ